MREDSRRVFDLFLGKLGARYPGHPWAMEAAMSSDDDAKVIEALGGTFFDRWGREEIEEAQNRRLAEEAYRLNAETPPEEIDRLVAQGMVVVSDMLNANASDPRERGDDDGYPKDYDDTPAYCGACEYPLQVEADWDARCPRCGHMN